MDVPTPHIGCENVSQKEELPFEMLLGSQIMYPFRALRERGAFIIHASFEGRRIISNY